MTLQAEGVVRGPRDPRRHTDGQPLSAEDLAEYDQRTLLFDVFIRHERDELIALGPPLLNLAAQALPIEVWIDGQKVGVRTSEITDRKLLKLRARLPEAGKKVYAVRIRFGELVDFRSDIERDGPLPSQSGWSLTTIQKNNRPHWIRDWATYYQVSHGVDRIVVYDNGSKDPEAVREALPKNSLVLPWHFPYGPRHSHRNKFTQTGALNHMRLRFGARAPVLNFDIDELLVVRSRSVRHLVETFSSVRFDQFAVPFVRPAVEDYSFSAFYLRNARSKGKSHKYSFLPHRGGALTPHTVQAEGRVPRYSPVIPTRLAYFLHYIGITTNWKSDYWDRTRESSEAGLVSDTTVPAFFASAAAKHVR